VDELEDDPGAGVADGVGDGAVAPGLLSSAFGAVADEDEELELLALSSEVAGCWVWALDELSDCWAMPAVPSPRITNMLRTATKRDFFMVHLPRRVEATTMPMTCGRRT
jgi:hypothetical protein